MEQFALIVLTGFGLAMAIFPIRLVQTKRYLIQYIVKTVIRGRYAPCVSTTEHNTVMTIEINPSDRRLRRAVAKDHNRLYKHVRPSNIKILSIVDLN